MEIIAISIWILLGVSALLKERINKFDYFMCWIALILNLVLKSIFSWLLYMGANVTG